MLTEFPWYGKGEGLYLSPLRLGEVDRVCTKCGCRFDPKNRVQKYCQKCGAEEAAKRKKRQHG